MLSVNDYVFYETEGICQITDKLFSPLDFMPKDKEYFVLKPFRSANHTMYVPVEQADKRLRPIVSKEKALSIIDHIHEILPFSSELDAKTLRNSYQEAMKNHMPEDWIKIIKTVHMRLNSLGDNGKPKKISETEHNCFDLAKKHLFSEFSLALELEYHDVESFISNRAEAKN